MKWLCLTAFLLCAAGIVLLFGLTPQQVSEDIGRLFARRLSLREKALLVSGRKKESRVRRTAGKIREALETTGHRGEFGAVCVCSVGILAAGPILWQLTGSIFVLPVALLAAVLLPFFAAENALEAYEKRLSEELETALSMVTSAYLRSGNLIAAVEESLDNLRQPVERVFREFLNNATSVSPDLQACIRRMQTSLDHRVFRDWCEVLLFCMEDASNREALLPVVGELTEVRLANSEMTTVISECRKEYYGMTVLTLCSVPLLFFLNRDWWNTLLHSPVGQAALSLCACVVLVTAYLMKRYTRPLDITGKGKKK